MVEFKCLSENDKKIICELKRKIFEGVLSETEDFEGLSKEGLEYYKNKLIEILPDDLKR